MFNQRIFCISPVKRPVARIGRGRRRPDVRPGRARKGASPAKPDLKFSGAGQKVQKNAMLGLLEILLKKPWQWQAILFGQTHSKKRKAAPEKNAEKSISVIFRMSPLFFKRNRVILKVNE